MSCLLVVAGPTAVGKTEFCIQLAKHLNTVIVNADSRQFYKETPIGTAAPMLAQMQGVPHFFVGNLSIFNYYNVWIYEQDVLKLLENQFKTHPYIILTGGSGLYIDTVCNGIDDMPDIDPKLRQNLQNCYAEKGLDYILSELERLDPEFYQIVDKKNHKRILRALEVCLQTGLPYSHARKNSKQSRFFDIFKICLTLPREQLCNRINQRTLKMIEEGFVEEARSLFPYKHLNALNTVGYKELFDYFEKKYDLQTAIEKIQTQTRRFAKRQMTWFKKDKDYQFIEPEKLIETVDNYLKTQDKTL